MLSDTWNHVKHLRSTSKHLYVRTTPGPQVHPYEYLPNATNHQHSLLVGNTLCIMHHIWPLIIVNLCESTHHSPKVAKTYLGHTNLSNIIQTYMRSHRPDWVTQTYLGHIDLYSSHIPILGEWIWGHTDQSDATRMSTIYSFV
jgi:hypothetical protein